MHLHFYAYSRFFFVVWCLYAFIEIRIYCTSHTTFQIFHFNCENVFMCIIRGPPDVIDFADNAETLCICWWPVPCRLCTISGWICWSSNHKTKRYTGLCHQLIFCATSHCTIPTVPASVIRCCINVEARMFTYNLAALWLHNVCLTLLMLSFRLLCVQKQPYATTTTTTTNN